MDQEFMKFATGDDVVFFTTFECPLSSEPLHLLVFGRQLARESHFIWDARRFFVLQLLGEVHLLLCNDNGDMCKWGTVKPVFKAQSNETACMYVCLF